jgi:hypothetical protein
MERGIPDLTMIATPFADGDRVQVCVSTAFVRAGASGTVVHVYPFTRDAYEVRFDGQSCSWLMWDDELAPLGTLTEADES